MCCALRCSHSRLFCAFRCCLLLLQLCLLFNNYVRPLSHLSLLAFVTFVFFTLRFRLFFILRCHLLIFINSCAFSYCLSFLLPDEASGRKVVNSPVCCFSGCCSLKYYPSTIFVLHKCRNFLSVAHFSAAILVFSARFGASTCCCNFAFCSTTYVRLLSRLSLLAFVTFVFFTIRCHQFFILRCHLFFFINSCAFSHCLSFLLPDEASGRNVVNFTVCCSTLVSLFKILYVNTFRPT